MPQNNQHITELQDFRDFCKNNNLEVLSGESINIVLYNLSKENKELRKIIEQSYIIDNVTWEYVKWNK